MHQNTSLALEAITHAARLLEASPTQQSRGAFNLERRVVMAAAYCVLDKAGATQRPSIRAAVSHLAQAYGRQHLSFHDGQTALNFVHVSKCGGTSMCELAKQHSRIAPSRGCWTDGDGPTWIEGVRSAQELTCKERGDVMEAGGYNAQFIERYMDGNGTICPNLVYGVVLREPLSRVISHVNEMMADVFNFRCEIDKPIFKNTISEVAGHPTSQDCSGLNRSHFFRNLLTPNADCGAERVQDALFSSLSAKVDYARMNPTKAADKHGFALHGKSVGDGLWGHICGMASNYQTRSLLGHAMDPEPFIPAAVPSDFEKDTDRVLSAMQILLRMSLVLTLDQMQESSGTALGGVLNATFGWTNVTEIAHEREQSANKTHWVLDPDGVEEGELEVLRQQNGADLALYSHARVLVSLDKRFFTDASLIVDNDCGASCG